MLPFPPFVTTAPQFGITDLTLPEELTGPIYYSPDSGDFYFPMRTMIRRHNPITLANTDFTPTNYNCPALTNGAARIMRKSATRLLVSNRVSNSNLWCTEIDNANATIGSQAITIGNAEPAAFPAWCYDAVGDRLFAPFRTAGGLSTIGTYKPDDSGRTISSPDFGPVTNVYKNGLALAISQWVSTTVSYLAYVVTSAWQAYSSFHTNDVPTGRVPQEEMNTDAILYLNNYYYYLVDNVAGGGDFIIKAEIVGPSHDRFTIFAGAPNRNYFAGSLVGHSGRIFIQGASGAFCILREADLSVAYEIPASGGSEATAGQAACDASRKLVYTGNLGSTAIRRVSGVR